MSEHCPTIRICAQDGSILIRDGLSICFYMRRHHHEVAQDVMRSLETYLRVLGPEALGWYADSEGDWQELDEAGWAHIQSRMQGSSPLITLSDNPREAGPYQFEYFGKDLEAPFFIDNPHAVCALEFWLPTGFLEERGPAHVRELALALAAPLPFNSGHVSLSFNALHQLAGVSDELRQLRLRYPGMDVHGLERIGWHIGTRIRGPHWLTFLGPHVLGELGGVPGLRSRLVSPDISVQLLDGERALVTLGEWPEAGDTTRGFTLPLHRELARVLEPWLYHEPPLRDPVANEDTLRWERRFLD
ncbi:type VI immunity family protein [Cystobacter fuscus]|uniref:type VI immunity family protein n=1 Tax=Cystobacter fuscus TaxID=43 RepID=UPI000686F9C8|nr:type VI immunity family protein [Cystobacter fuscus]